MEDPKMKKISVEDKTQIKQLLYYGNVLGIKDDRYLPDDKRLKAVGHYEYAQQ